VGQSSAPPHHFGGASVDSTSGQAAGQGWESGGGEATQPSAPAGTTGQAEWAAAEVGVLPTPVAWWGLDAKVRAQLREITRRQGTGPHASSPSPGAGAGPQGLVTPAKIRKLQETRYRKRCDEGARRAGGGQSARPVRGGAGAVTRTLTTAVGSSPPLPAPACSTQAPPFSSNRHERGPVVRTPFSSALALSNTWRRTGVSALRPPSLPAPMRDEVRPLPASAGRGPILTAQPRPRLRSSGARAEGRRSEPSRRW
jgi:hypothetical protein